MRRFNSLAGILVVASFFVLAGTARAIIIPVQPCPPTMHPAKENEVPGVEAGTCTDNAKNASDNILFGGCDSNPYPFLEQRHNGDRSNSFVSPVAGVGDQLKKGINPSLACRLKKFMEFAETKGCFFKINSAMRPKQTCNPSGGACAPQGRSCHQYGLAVDIGGSSQCLAWALNVLGRKNPNSPFGLHSAYAEHPGYRHLQCIENLQAACSTQTKGCDGKVNINPDLSEISGPSNPLSQAIRNALGMQQQPPSPPPMQQQPMQTQPQQQQQTAPPLGTNNSTPQPAGTCAPQFYCSNSTYYYRTSSCVDQTYQQCPNGCDSAGLTCSLSSSILSNLLSVPTSTPAGRNNSTTTPPDAASSSPFDLIDAYANPVSDLITISDIGSATSVALNPDIQEIVMAEERPTSTRMQASGSATGSIMAPQIVSPQTFTSNDLSRSPSTGTLQNSTTFQILQTLKNVLLYILDVLKPFGSRNPQLQQGQLME